MTKKEQWRCGVPGSGYIAEGEIRFDGMTLRDYFAGQVLAGMDDAAISRYVAHANANDERAENCIARTAYSIADAMLTERDK